MAWYIYNDKREALTTKNTLPSKPLLQIWWRNQSFPNRQKLKELKHHPTSFTTNAKGTSPGRKHNRRKRSTENKPKTTEKQVTGEYISIITLNVIGLNTPNKKHRLAGQMKTCAAYMHFHLPHHSVWPSQTVHNHFISLIMFPLRLIIVIFFYFLSGYWLWKLLSIFSIVIM